MKWNETVPQFAKWNPSSTELITQLPLSAATGPTMLILILHPGCHSSIPSSIWAEHSSVHLNKLAAKSRAFAMLTRKTDTNPQTQAVQSPTVELPLNPITINWLIFKKKKKSKARRVLLFIKPLYNNNSIEIPTFSQHSLEKSSKTISNIPLQYKFLHKKYLKCTKACFIHCSQTYANLYANIERAHAAQLLQSFAPPPFRGLFRFCSWRSSINFFPLFSASLFCTNIMAFVVVMHADPSG